MRQQRAYASLLFIIYGNMALYGFVQTLRGIIYPLIKTDYDASYSRQGLLVLLVQIIMAFSCVISGIFLNRAGFKKSILLGFGIVLAGMAFFRFSAAYWTAAGFIILIQLGLGFFEISLNGIGIKTFTRNSALMMNLLHFFYGAGAVIGPWFGGLVANTSSLGWRGIYFAGLVPVLVMALATFILAPGEKKTAAGRAAEKSASGEEAAPVPSSGGTGYSFRWAITNPLVWRFGICLGFTTVIECGATNWSGLYLLDVFGIDPKTGGAAFISIYFLLFTVSRLLNGFLIEKAGYLRSVFFGILATVLILTAGFLLGRHGVRILPVTGLFVGIAFPTILAMSIGVFGKGAQAAGSAIIVIAFSLNGVIQFLIGLTNRFIGAAWGYRSCVLYGVILLALLLRLRKNPK
ncbi:MAG: MFS transporter [Treponema sp.]|jgi:fucose permease|nr:MFS transporter [Treponema sp.]